MAYCYAMMALTIWRNKDLNNAEVRMSSYILILKASFVKTSQLTVGESGD